MNTMTRRTALTTGAAAITTGAITAPGAGAHAGLAGDPVLPAFEAFEAALLEYVAICDHAHAVGDAVEVDLPPEPHRGRTYKEMSPAEDEEARQWRVLRNRRVTARLAGKTGGI